LGFKPEEARSDLPAALALPKLIPEGIFTHFAVSDEFGDDFTLEQFKLFTDTVEAVERQSGHRFEIRHCANSGAVINYRETCLDMVRPGLALYGHYPAVEKGGLDLRPVMQFKARISAIHEHQPGETISYGRRYTVKDRPVRAAVVSAGYADGIFRALSGKMSLLIRGQRVRQIGRICMDMCMADVTDVPCAVGDVVTIFGTDGKAVASLDELAGLAGTISYELLCAISPRVPRIYLRRHV
jgi:alanine racemase